MAGTREIYDRFLDEFGASPDEMTKDERFTFTKVVCLGSCDTAPMMQINEDYHESLTPESAMKILKELS